MEYKFDELVEQAKKGKSQASEEIIAALQPLIYAWMRRNARIMAKEDLYQEACVVVLECIRDFESSRKVPFLGYVKKCLQYRSWKLKKTHGFEISLNQPLFGAENETMQDMLESGETPVEQAVVERSEVERLMLALDKLTAKQRQVVQKYYFEGINLKNIAESNGVHHKAVMHIKKRALKALREKMQ